MGAVPVHDNPCGCRYDVGSVGDGFQVAFHTPAEAVGWCLHVQSLLVTAAWPSVLEEHVRTALLCMPTDLGAPSPSLSLASQG